MIKIPIVEEFKSEQAMGIVIGHINLPEATLEAMSKTANTSGKPFRLGYVLHEKKGIVVFTLTADMPEVKVV